jgi:hypothetical protein
MGNLCLNESFEEEILRAKDIVDGILKAKKQMRMYPSNNPMYINASRGIFEKFSNYFDLHKSITFKVTMNALSYKEEQIYHKPGKDDNLAFFFFKDGLREISFLKGIDQRELEEFVKILNTDFEADAPDDDVVTMLWEGDLKYIKYFVDQDFLGNWEVAHDSETSEESIISAYQDAMKEEAEKTVVQVQLNESDIQYLTDEIQKQKQPKLEKIISILSELLHQTEESNYIKELTRIFKDILNYCLMKSDFRNSALVMDMIKSAIEDGEYNNEDISHLKSVYDEINSEAFIGKIGKTLDNLSKIEKDNFIAYVKHLDKRSILFFINLLREAQTIKGRHFIIDALVMLGQHDVKEVAKGLNDSKWYVVRNVVFILGKIASPETKGLLTKALSHSDVRVRKEAVITIGNFKSSDMVRHLAGSLNDSDKSIRTTAARMLGSIKTEDAKKVVFSELSGKQFMAREFTEKKEFYRVIANWQDPEVKDFLIKTLNKKKFFKKAKNDENRACAAYALGIMKDKDSIKSIEKASRSKNRILRELSTAALKKMED